MEIIHGYKGYNGEEVVLAFGNFDGVHLGHSHVISTVKNLSIKKKIPTAILTFEPHPATALFNKKDFRLTDLKQKIELIESYNIDYLYVVNFDQDFAKMSPEYFVQEVLVSSCRIKHIVTGHECAFGYKRLGNLKLIKHFSTAYNYHITELDSLVIEENMICSSSLIRECLVNGNIDLANKLLGRPYNIDGVVAKGVGRGKKIGFPTINLSIGDDMIKPKFGVYFAKVTHDNNYFYGLVNIGVRPTFGAFEKPILEMHILDFSGNLYNCAVKIELLKFLRPEKKFDNVEELKKQIYSDIIEAHRFKVSL